MSALRSWFRGSSSVPAKSQPPSKPASIISDVDKANGPRPGSGPSDIEHALAAAELIMNDDIAGAEALFLSRDSSFHTLGLGVCAFMTSVLGQEKDAMAQAVARLTESENRSWADMKKAQKAGAASTSASAVYPPGSEYALAHAQSMLMNAVVAVMHESVTEALKGVYKLRKAYIALEALMAAEQTLTKGAAGGTASRPVTATRPRMSEDMMPGSFDEGEFAGLESDSDEFVDAVSTPDGTRTPAPAATATATATAAPAAAPADPSSDADLFTTPTDMFTHSGVITCYGVLLLLLSMVPPSFSRLLSVIGFRGDRDRGLRLLWAATRYRNFNGAIAALALFAYYNGLMGLADILPRDADAGADDETAGYPLARCMALLEDMRARYPDSMLWRLQEAKELAAVRRLPEALAILAANEAEAGRSAKAVSQTAALNAFELALNSLFALDWAPVRAGFLRCAEVNKWSHAMYYFLAASAELELYRDAHHRARALPEGDPERAVAESAARTHKRAAEDLFRKGPTLAGRKKFLAKQMPFDVLVSRKIQKWEERAAALGGQVDLADAILASPAMEMLYLWNGSKRMDAGLLARARALLDPGRCTMTAEQRSRVLELERDEPGLAAVADAALLRGLGRTDEARAALEPVLRTDKAAFKGPTRDDYVLPAAHYEMAVAAWADCCDEARWPADPAQVDAFRRLKVEECQGYLDKLVKWEAFVLDARFGMRIQAGLNTVTWLKAKKGW